MTGEHALAALIGTITAYETWCIRSGHHDALISRTMDRLRDRHLILDVAAHAIILTTALHLVRRLPARLDPYSRCST